MRRRGRIEWKWKRIQVTKEQGWGLGVEGITAEKSDCGRIPKQQIPLCGQNWSTRAGPGMVAPASETPLCPPPPATPIQKRKKRYNDERQKLSLSHFAVSFGSIFDNKINLYDDSESSLLSIWSIISSILPLLLALLWFVVRNSGEGKQLGGLDVFWRNQGKSLHPTWDSNPRPWD